MKRRCCCLGATAPRQQHRLFILHLRDNASNLVCGQLGEPELAIRAARDLKGTTCGVGEGKLGDLTTRSDASKLVCISFGEPEIAIGAYGDASQLNSTGRYRILADLAAGGD